MIDYFSFSLFFSGILRYSSQGERGATELAESGSLGTCERIYDDDDDDDDDDDALKQQWKIETSVDRERRGKSKGSYR
uniref:Uncharacterized protein n=1 Tax=Trichogramma kaykai TaxID=54128 RepID=A0ABD2VZJ2_9HYME